MNFKFNKTDKYLILVYYAFAIPLSCVDYADYDNKWQLVWEVFISLIFDVSTVYIIVFILFPKYFFQKRYVTFFGLMSVLLFTVGYVWLNSYCLVANCTGDKLSVEFMYAGFVIVVESVGILTSVLIAKKFYDAQLYYSQLEKEKKENELRFLKSQIDPHFLFNNLNTVDSLIDTDPKAAKIYLNKLSKLYRYLISSKDMEVVPLEEELAFAQNYIYLIESRFGDAFQFEIKNRVGEEAYLIPPGALQTLLENIVKHNQAGSENPIKTTIEIDENSIVIINNLRAKKRKPDSTGTGLSNLKMRYKLLIDKGLEVESNENYRVKLPSIKQVF